MRVPLAWRPRGTPIVASAVCAEGDPSVALARCLVTWPHLDRLVGIAGRRLICVQGDEEMLPTVDGTRRLGWSEDRQLLLPVEVEPELDAAQVTAAVKRRYPTARGPLVLLGPSSRCLSLAQARDISIAALERWLTANL